MKYLIPSQICYDLNIQTSLHRSYNSIRGLSRFTVNNRQNVHSIVTSAKRLRSASVFNVCPISKSAAVLAVNSVDTDFDLRRLSSLSYRCDRLITNQLNTVYEDQHTSQRCRDGRSRVSTTVGSGYNNDSDKTDERNQKLKSKTATKSTNNKEVASSESDKTDEMNQNLKSKTATKSTNNKDVARFLWQYLWPDGRRERLKVIGAVSSLLISKFSTIHAPILLGSVANHINRNDAKAITKTIGAYGLARMTASLFGELRNALFSEVSHAAGRAVACKAFMHLHEMNLDYLLSMKAGELNVILSRGTNGVTRILNLMMFQILPTIVELGLVLRALSTKLGAHVAGVSALTVFSYGYFTAKITARRIGHRKHMSKAEEVAGGLLSESLTNAEAVRYNANEDFELCRYENQRRLYERAATIVQRSLSFLNFGQQFIFNFGLSSALALGVLRKRDASAGDIILASNLLFQLAAPLNFFGSVWRDTTTNLQAIQKLCDVVEVNKNKCDVLSNSVEFRPRSGSVLIDNVFFDYDRRDKQSEKTTIVPVYQGLSLEIQSGQKIALVGPSGGGKSTIFKLLCRLYDTKSGRILIDGQDISSIDNIKSLREKVAVLPQDVVLFNDSILHNILYGRLDASYEEVVEAAKVAHIHDFIMSLPLKYDTPVGERGLQMSGGEKQRIGIARCVIRKPVLFLFDEATSSLDTNTEREILNNIKKSLGKCTRIVIAHRLSTITDADKILYLEKGAILESGTFGELLAMPDGKFRAMWDKQADNVTFSNI